MNIEQQYTPGPWHKTNDTPIIIYGDDLKGLAHVIGKTMGKDESELAEANARLIAAAPDLLEALMGMLGECVAVGTPSYWGMEAARLAIAKATGNQ